VLTIKSENGLNRQARRTLTISSENRTCQALRVDRSTYHYRSKRTGQAVLMKQIREIAETRVRYGYRRIYVLLRREGWPVNAKRVCRLYCEMGIPIAQQIAQAPSQGAAA
jgi:transposase InsO family protein